MIQDLSPAQWSVIPCLILLSHTHTWHIFPSSSFQPDLFWENMLLPQVDLLSSLIIWKTSGGVWWGKTKHLLIQSLTGTSHMSEGMERDTQMISSTIMMGIWWSWSWWWGGGGGERGLKMHHHTSSHVECQSWSLCAASQSKHSRFVLRWNEAYFSQGRRGLKKWKWKEAKIMSQTERLTVRHLDTYPHKYDSPGDLVLSFGEALHAFASFPSKIWLGY